MSVRTSKLFTGQVDGTHENDLFTVASPKVCIVKSVAVRNAGGDPAYFSIGGKDGESGEYCDFFGYYDPDSLGAATSVTTEGWWVLETGDLLYLWLDGGGPIDVWVSGTLLE